MTREEEIIAAAKEHESHNYFGEIVKKARNVCSAYGIGFLEGAVWADKTMLDKACEWLRDNLPGYWQQINANDCNEFLNNFKKAMR